MTPVTHFLQEALFAWMLFGRCMTVDVLAANDRAVTVRATNHSAQVRVVTLGHAGPGAVMKTAVLRPGATATLRVEVKGEQLKAGWLVQGQCEWNPISPEGREVKRGTD